jgi:polysaccharide biosynthesis transport protein
VDLSHYLTIARRWWWTLLAAAWVAGLSAYFVASAAAPTYESTARILVGPIGNADLDTLRASASLVETYAQLVTSEPVLDETIDRLELDVATEVLREQTTATADELTRLLAISVEAASPDDAAAIANDLAAVVMALPEGELARPESQMRLVDPAAPEEVPVAPDVVLIVALAAAAGLVAALVLVVLIEHMSDTVRHRHDLPRLSNLPLLGVVPLPRWFRPTVTRPLIVEAYPESRVAASYRLVAGKIPLATRDRSVHRLVVLGTEPSQATGQFAANLAAVLTRSGRKVTLVDADETGASLTELFSAVERTGLSNLLDPDVTVTKASMEHVVLNRPPDMAIVPRGSAPFRLVDEGRARKVLSLLSGSDSIAVVVTSPEDRSGSSLVWARAADAVVLVAERDHSRREAVRSAIESLQLVGASVIGIVLLEHRRSLRGRGAPAPQPLAQAQSR